MCFLTAGFAEVLIIERLDVGVVVGAAFDFALVLGVESLHALFEQGCVAVEEGLTAAVDAAAGAGHDLDRLETVLVSSDHLEDLAGVAQSGADGDVDGFSGSDLDLCLFDSIESADGAEVDGIAFEVLAVEHIVDGAAGGLKHTAGDTEDVSGTGGVAERIVVLFVVHIGEVDSSLLEHTAKLAGGDDVIDVTDSAGSELGTGGLVFLRLTGHNGNHDKIFGLHADLLGVVALGDGTEHLLRRFAA